MKIQMTVEGKEEMVITIEYKNTTLDTVKMVENALVNALLALNK